MKKYLLSFMTLMACVSFFASCGGDDPDEPTGFEYAEPCLDWTFDQAGLQQNNKQYASSPWTKAAASDEYQLSYWNRKTNAYHNYGFGKDGKLCIVGEQYDYSEQNLKVVLGAIAKRLNVQFIEYHGNYAAVGIVKNAIVAITVEKVQNFVLVKYDRLGSATSVDDAKYLQGKWKSYLVDEDGTTMANEYSLEFNGEKVVSDLSLRKEEFTYKYETGKLTFVDDFGFKKVYTITYFTVDVLVIQYQEFGKTVTIVFKKQ